VVHLSRLAIGLLLGLSGLGGVAIVEAVEPASAASGRTAVIVNLAADGVVNFISAQVGRFQKPGITQDDVFAAVDRLVDQYDGTGVTHLFWNVNYQRVGYASRVWPSYWDVPDPEKNVTEWPRSYYQLHKLGVDDVFARAIPRCRQRGLSPWISLRMNDHHYTKDFSRVSPLFFEHPELRTRGGTGLFNYARPEVRQHYMKLVEEVLQRYDVDGLELDWIRTADNFEQADFERGRGILTEFVTAVRKQTTAAAGRWGHPVRLAVRVPATPAFARGKGFEAVAWAREKLVDMLIPADWWSGYTNTPVEEWRSELGAPGRDCLIVPCTGSTYACTAKGRTMARNLVGMRGFAASMLDRGADGVYLFNHFEAVDTTVRRRDPAGKSSAEGTVADLLRAGGSLAGATSGPRVHALTIHDGLPRPTDYKPPLPATIDSQKPLAAQIHIGPAPAGGKCFVHVGVDPSDGPAATLGVRVNGQACRRLDDFPPPAKPDPRPEVPRLHVCEVAARVLRFEVPPAALVRGFNRVEVSLEGGGPPTVVWLELALEP